jgi:hypothetical protein
MSFIREMFCSVVSYGFDGFINQVYEKIKTHFELTKYLSNQK